MSLKIALAGNPNSGKTTLFNLLTGGSEITGNRPGVTVDIKESALLGHSEITVADLPGIYSLSPYSGEEVISRDYLTENKIDVILNIVDGTRLERSLYLTTQLAEFDIPVVLAVNMIDEVGKRGGEIDFQKLSAVMGCMAVPISASKNEGIKNMLKAVMSAAEKGETQKNKNTFSLPDERYMYISNVMDSIFKRRMTGKSFAAGADSIVLNKYTAFPIFAAVMLLVYYVSITAVGSFFAEASQNAADGIVMLAESSLCRMNANAFVMGFITDGMIRPVCSVVGFLPQMITLFAMISFLEDCGYMARTAFIMDGVMRGFGLSGCSFIPILVGTGCGVPGIMASRTISNECERKITVITTTFIPCSAKLPLISLVTGIMPGGTWWTAASAYFIGIAAIMCSGTILKKIKHLREADTPFVMEIPEYRIPSAKNIFISVTERAGSFVKRALTVILLSSVIIWILSHLTVNGGRLAFDAAADIDGSILGYIGTAVGRIFIPLGFSGAKTSVAVIMGLVAKEEIVAVLGSGSITSIGSLAAYSFLVFNLLCAPCFAAIAAIKHEMNNAKWTLFAILYQCAFAYAVSLIIYRIGLLVCCGEFTVWTLASIIIAAVIACLLRKTPQTHTVKRCAPCMGCPHNCRRI